MKQRTKQSKKNLKGKSRNSNPPFIGESIEEEGQELEDSGFANSQGETIYEEFDNPENYEDLSDFDEPHFYG